MYIIHLGFSGFPKGLASVQRILFTFKGLKYAGATPLIINKISHNQYTDKKKVKLFDGIVYVNTAILNSKPPTFIKRNFNKVSGYFGELILLYKKRKKIDAAILYSTYFLEYPYYFILSRIFGFKLIIQYVEMFSVIPGRSSFFTKINDKLIDRYICSFCDGIIAISDYLIQHIKTIVPNKPIIKIPANCDFSQMETLPTLQSGEYLMYCGTIYYEDVIEFIISLFIKLKENNKYTGGLLLIISGDKEQNWEKLSQFIKTAPFQKDISIKSNITHDELMQLYKSADILIIPLRNTSQDKARFPHKIGEYTAAKRPILSTNIGELNSYFKNGESAILADEYSIDAYFKSLCNVLPHKELLDQIGIKGYKIGFDNFNYKTQGKHLFHFIDNL
jgi:glycosyltransferase involved in cell wall biosynthesis